MIVKPMDNNIYIEIDNLTKMFKRQKVLDELTVSFRKGERVSLSGPNGAGKTTLLRCLLGHYTYSGKLDIFGMNPRIKHEQVMQYVSFVPQTPPPMKMTVSEMLEFFKHLSGRKESDFTAISDDLGFSLEENAHKPFFKLSGGMKQKLLVTFALGRHPKILLMDEPSANLDPKARDIFFEYLHNYDKDTLMIISSHRLSEVSKLANRFIDMDLGVIVKDEWNELKEIES